MLSEHIDQVSVEVFDDNDPRAVAAFVDWVRETLAPRIPADARIVSIDGWDGAGKSAIGRVLAKRLAAVLIDLDEHLDRDRRGFLDHLRLPELDTAITTGLDRACRTIVTGCMVDLALERIRRPANFRIYVMRLSGMIANPDSLWVDKFEELYGDKTAEELIAAEEKSARKLAKWEGSPVPESQGIVSGLRRELIRYHRDRRPHDCAHLIVKVIERRP